MLPSINNCLLLRLLVVSIFCYFTPHVLADNISTRSPTATDLNAFKKLLESKDEFYQVGLLTRECQKISGKYTVSSNGSISRLRYDKYTNVLKVETQPGVTSDKTSQRYENRMRRECPYQYLYQKIKSVVIYKNQIVGWIFITNRPYCKVPRLRLHGSGGCSIDGCFLTIPEGLEYQLVTQNIEYAEIVRKNLKPRPQVDKWDHDGRKTTCTELN